MYDSRRFLTQFDFPDDLSFYICHAMYYPMSLSNAQPSPEVDEIVELHFVNRGTKRYWKSLLRQHLFIFQISFSQNTQI